MATKWAEYKRIQRAKAKAEKKEEEKPDEQGRWPNRQYNEDGSLKLITQTCKHGCGGVWTASIEIECPYCFGEGKQRPRTNRN